ncbi:MAG: hypothetical protein AB1646_11285 [Thermodesulfobacteriota bacterium]
MSAEPKPTIEEPEEGIALDPEEPWEDYLDYCAAAEAIDDALKSPGKIKKTGEFAKELGFEF